MTSEEKLVEHRPFDKEETWKTLPKREKSQYKRELYEETEWKSGDRKLEYK